MSSRKIPSAPIPHSWALDFWPEHVYPGRASKGRYIVRANRDSLIEAGALTRVGRDLVVIGSRYQAWLEAQQDRVAGFDIAPNRSPPAEAVA